MRRLTARVAVRQDPALATQASQPMRSACFKVPPWDHRETVPCLSGSLSLFPDQILHPNVMRVKSVNVLVRYAAVAPGNWLFIQELRLELEIPRDTPWAIPSEQLFQCIATFRRRSRGPNHRSAIHQSLCFRRPQERFHRFAVLQIRCSNPGIHVILTENGFANVGRKWSRGR